jgi:hypothetical protein
VPELTYSESILIRRTPTQVYDLVSNIERTGEWSPICKACWWDSPSEGAQVGAWFTGRNEADGRTWETRSEVVAAERGVEFAWLVGGAFVRWGYRLAEIGGATELTETWQFTPEGIAMFHEKYGTEADARIDRRAAQAHAGIPKTLAGIKRIAEAGEQRV